MAKRHVEALKAKEKKQKMVAAVLGVVFLGIMAFQGPKLWKQLHPPQPTESPAASPSTPTANPSAQPAEAAPSAPASLAASPSPHVADGQLASFGLFSSKDPFAQQLSEESAGAATTAPAARNPVEASPPVRSGSIRSAGTATAPTRRTAVISVNGTLYTVSVRGDFPTASASDPSIVPLFHLVALTAHTAKISIVGGSYANGAPTVTLRENKPVTLMNTADGTRYRLILKPAGTPVSASTKPAASSESSPSSQPTTVTLPPPSP